MIYFKKYYFNDFMIIWIIYYFPGSGYRDVGQGCYNILYNIISVRVTICVCCQIALDTTYWTAFNHITIWGSLVSYFVLDYFYNYAIGGPYVGSLTVALTQATFWFTAVLTVCIPPFRIL